MHGTVKWLDGAMFIGESGSGHSVVMDGPEDLGGHTRFLAFASLARGHQR